MTSVNIFPDNPDHVIVREPPAANVVKLTNTDVVTIKTVGSPGRQGVDGLPGPQGLPGRDGISSNANYEHVQNAVSGVWLIQHNLGYHPSVTAFDSGGSIVEGEVETIDMNSLRLHFTNAFAGGAYLS